MTPNNFINRYFKSEAILLKIEHSEKRSMTTFMNYFENLHSVADKLKDMEVILNLETTYTKEYNIPKIDLLCMPENIPVMTTKGLVFPKSRDSMGRMNNNLQENQNIIVYEDGEI